MCGILAILESTSDENTIKQKALNLSAKLRHRGPDWSGIYVKSVESSDGKKHVNVLCHERLAVIDLLNGSQPLYDDDKTTVLSVNGEIYNHKQLRKKLTEVSFRTQSDCEPILHLYKINGKDAVYDLDGVFAFVVYKVDTDEYFAARDAIGVCPMYYGYGEDGSIWFSSEVKALVQNCKDFHEFPPGHYYAKGEGLTKWYNPIWTKETCLYKSVELYKLRFLLEKSVIKRMMSDVPFGVLLSGGLDSSLIASIVVRNSQKRVEDEFSTDAWFPKIHSFSIGLEDSPDLVAARQVSQCLKTVHHEFHYTIEEGINALDSVIYHIESYDVTTVRASIPMYLLARRIKAMGVKMVLSGEGADEVFGGYLYFHKAPDAKSFQEECVSKVKMLSRYDCLRANKATAAWGVEIRVPFLDKDFLDFAMTIDPKDKMIQDRKEGKIEKYILRDAFNDHSQPYLPDSILWRQKEQFSDGVGYKWIDALKENANARVTDEELINAKHVYPINTPRTKEEYLNRKIFHSHFPQESAAKLIPWGESIACSTSKAIKWDEKWMNNADPSGRAVNQVHANPV